MHLITSNVDGQDEESALIKDYYRGNKVETTHFRCTLPPETQSTSVEATFVRSLPCKTRL